MKGEVGSDMDKILSILNAIITIILRGGFLDYLIVNQ